MKRLFIVILALASPLLAQQPKTDAQKPVAVVNGEVITAEKLDQMYDSLTPEMRSQYAINGGKGALLENYIRKRLVIQEAAKTGFDKRPAVKADIETAKENALFDRYVRDVIAGPIVNNAAMKNYYEFHQAQFAEPEMVKLRTITITNTSSGAKPHSAGQAMDLAKKALSDVLVTIPRSANAAAAVTQRAALFGKLARAYSEDRAAPSGGDLGWIARNQLDPDLANVAFSLPVGLASGIIETKTADYIVFVEGRRAAGTLSFDEAKPRIRDLMLQEHSEDVIEAVNRATNELGDKGKVAIYPENIR